MPQARRKAKLTRQRHHNLTVVGVPREQIDIRNLVKALQYELAHGGLTAPRRESQRRSVK